MSCIKKSLLNYSLDRKPRVENASGNNQNQHITSPTVDARSHDTLQSKTYHHGISHANLIQESHKDASSLTSTHMSTHFKKVLENSN